MRFRNSPRPLATLGVLALCITGCCTRATRGSEVVPTISGCCTRATSGSEQVFTIPTQYANPLVVSELAARVLDDDRAWERYQKEILQHWRELGPELANVLCFASDAKQWNRARTILSNFSAMPEWKAWSCALVIERMTAVRDPARLDVLAAWVCYVPPEGALPGHPTPEVIAQNLRLGWNALQREREFVRQRGEMIERILDHMKASGYVPPEEKQY